jgi:hypothetical protein
MANDSSDSIVPPPIREVLTYHTVASLEAS